MKWNIVAVVLAIALFGGGYYYYSTKGNQGAAPPPTTTDTSTTQPAQTDTTPSSATNYDECIAEGNKPLPDDPTKCLTKDGHLFIQGVVEQ